MRLPLLVAAVAATAASALPAEAAVYPVCATHIELAAPGASKSCTTGNTPFERGNRQVDVVVASGTVDASVTCFNYPYANTTTSRRLSAGQHYRLRLTERGNTCVAKLTAVTGDAAATAVSWVTPILVDYPVPA